MKSCDHKSQTSGSIKLPYSACAFVRVIKKRQGHQRDVLKQLIFSKRIYPPRTKVSNQRNSFIKNKYGDI